MTVRALGRIEFHHAGTVRVRDKTEHRLIDHAVEGRCEVRHSRPSPTSSRNVGAPRYLLEAIQQCCTFIASLKEPRARLELARHPTTNRLLYPLSYRGRRSGSRSDANQSGILISTFSVTASRRLPR